MIWSISGYKQFNKCPRQWYYRNIVADARVKKDAYRREMTILSKLQTLDAWRGALVDDVISRLLVSAINRKYPIDKGYYLKEASKLFENQFEYGIFQKYRQSDSKLSGDENFAAFIKSDNGVEILNEEIEKAKNDIELALSNLLDDHDFITYLQSASHLVSQRTLTYPYDRFNVRAIPDLIAFFDNSPPHIFDWKVHTYGTNSYDEQLISYAAALYKVAHSKPHVDFPLNIKDYQIYDYKLSEYQLLHKDRIKRDYEVTYERLEELGTKMSGSIMEMYMSGCHKKYSDLSPENFETTSFIENCINCPFKNNCKAHDHEIRDKYLQN